MTGSEADLAQIRKRLDFLILLTGALVIMVWPLFLLALRHVWVGH